MHPIRRQRLIAVIFVVVVATVAVAFITYALRQNINLFYTPAQIVAGEAPLDARIRIGGMVVPDSVKRAPGGLETQFLVTDGDGEVRIAYTGILPDLFAENEAAVATGSLGENGVFTATEVLAKHDENYTPAEVEAAMSKAKARAREARL